MALDPGHARPGGRAAASRWTKTVPLPRSEASWRQSSRPAGEGPVQVGGRPDRAVVRVGSSRSRRRSLGVLEQKPSRSTGRASHPKARERSSSRLWSWPWVAGEDVGDPIDHRVDQDGVAGDDAGDELAVAEVVAAGQGDVAAVGARPRGASRGPRGRPRWSWPRRARSPWPGRGRRWLPRPRGRRPHRRGGERREMTATLRATQGSHSSARPAAQVRGSRCCRSRMSAIGARVVGCGSRGPSRAPAGESRTGGVPSPPGLVIGSRSRPAHRAKRPSGPRPASPRPPRPTREQPRPRGGQRCRCIELVEEGAWSWGSFYSNTSSNQEVASNLWRTISLSTGAPEAPTAAPGCGCFQDASSWVSARARPQRGLPALRAGPRLGPGRLVGVGGFLSRGLDVLGGHVVDGLCDDGVCPGKCLTDLYLAGIGDKRHDS